MSDPSRQTDEQQADLGSQVLRTGLDAAKRELGSNLSAAFALGSLAHGGFAPLVSDVDLALVLERLGESTAQQISGIADSVRRQEPSSELATRLSVFWSDWDGVRGGVGAAGRLPELDRLDLLEHGVLLYGQDLRTGARKPSKDDLVRQAAVFALDKFDPAYRASLADPAGLVAGGPRVVTKAVLFPVRFRYTLHTGRIGRNEDAAQWHSDDGSTLVSAAMRWRLAGIDDPSGAVHMLEGEVIGLYRQFAIEYTAALKEMNEHDLAQRLTAWASAL